MNTNKTPSRDSIRRKMNKSLGEILTLNTTFTEIPIDDICDAVKSCGALVLQEDDTEFSGIFCGREGESCLKVKHADFDKSFYMRLTWYKREFSGRYEIVCYIS